MPPALNKNHSGVKRIMQEARELAADTSTDYTAAPLEDDIFEWHATLRGAPGTDYEGGLYHFRILLPAEYPFRPPAIQLLTPSGRFELNTNICISFTNYHEESWQPAWGVRTAIIGLQGFFPLNGKDAVGVGGIEYPPSERKRLAKASREWKCEKCGKQNMDGLPDPVLAVPPDEIAPSLPTQQSIEALETTTEPSATADSVAKNDLERPANAIDNSASATASHSNPSPSSSSTSPVRRELTSPTSNTAVLSTKPSRPPIILDTAICVLLVLAAALLCRRIM